VTIYSKLHGFTCGAFFLEGGVKRDMRYETGDMS
jgi:hypothetical protein